MSLLNETANFSYQRMDDMAREIIYLKNQVDLLSTKVFENQQWMFKLGERLKQEIEDRKTKTDLERKK
jgi:hypothetical protein